MAITRFFRSLSTPERLLLVGLAVFSFIPAFGGLFRIFELTTGSEVLPPNPRALIDPVPIAAHVLASVVFCIAGAFQLLPSVRRNRPEAHRLVGRIVALAGAVAAFTGMWMTQFFSFPTELQGAVLYVTRMIAGCSMIGLIAWAVIAINARDIPGHFKAMLRAYAIGQGASTQSFLAIGWIVASGAEPQGLLRDGLMVCGWLLNLSVVELAIFNLRNRSGRSDWRGLSSRSGHARV